MRDPSLRAASSSSSHDPIRHSVDENYRHACDTVICLMILYVVYCCVSPDHPVRHSRNRVVTAANRNCSRTESTPRRAAQNLGDERTKCYIFARRKRFLVEL